MHFVQTEQLNRANDISVVYTNQYPNMTGSSPTIHHSSTSQDARCPVADTQ